MTVAITNIIHALSANWVVTKAPRLGILIAQGKYTESDNLFLKSFLVALFVVFISAGSFWCLGYILNVVDHPFKSHILPPLCLGLFLMGILFNSVFNNLAMYLRAQKREPFAPIYFIGGILILALSMIFGKRFGVFAVAASYFSVLTFIQGPISVFIFLRSRADRGKI